jgi:hypothetical protein
MCSHLEKHVYHAIQVRFPFIFGSSKIEYIPCIIMFICWVHLIFMQWVHTWTNCACHTIYLAKQCLYLEFTPYWANIALKKNPLDLLSKIGFENWTSFLVFKKKNHFKYLKRISNTFKKYLTSFENVEYIIKQHLSDIQVSFHNPH